jgi:hypothetical protein
MVATDVASRGIGMIESPAPYPATPSRLQSSALLSTLRRFLDCVFCPGSFVSIGSLFIGCLGSRVRHFLCFTRNIPNSQVLSPVQDVELAFLDSFKLSPRLPNKRTRMCGFPALALPAMDSSCQMLRESWMHLNAAPCLAALECCYTIFLFLLTHI